MDAIGLFIVNQPIDVAFAGEAGNNFMFMFIDPALKIVGNTSVERSCAVSHHVDVVTFHKRGLLSFLFWT